MEKTVMIDGKPVVFKKTAGTDREYAQKYGREFIVDMMQMYKIQEQFAKIDMKNPQEIADFYSSIEQDFIYNMLHMMAKKADPTVPDDLIAWLDQFDTFNALQIFTELSPMLVAERRPSPKNA